MAEVGEAGQKGFTERMMRTEGKLTYWTKRTILMSFINTNKSNDSYTETLSK